MRTYRVQVRQHRFIQPIARPVDERFRERLELLQANAPVSASEEPICEFLIAPILLAGWGQCLAAMLAAQQRNDSPEETIHGGRRCPWRRMRDAPLG